MLESLSLKNFQRFRRFKIDFGWLTCLVGETDAGKSAVLRALYWLSFNRPSGDSMVKFGENACRAVLRVDGVSVKRRKSPGTHNLYAVGGEVYKAFGQGVPEDVAKLLAVDDTNFQSQFDGPFWLADSPGEVSRKLNAVVNLDVIDETLSNAQRQTRRAQAELEVCHKRVEEARIEKASLAWVPSMLKELDRIDGVSEQIQALRARIDSAELQIERATQLAEKCLNADRAKRDAALLNLLGDSAFEKRERVNSLEHLVTTAEELSVRSAVAEVDTSTVDELYIKRNELRSRVARLESQISHAEMLERQICASESRATRNEGTLEAESRGRCPLCGALTKHAH